MSQGRVLLSCFALISSSLNSFKDFIPYIFPIFSLFFLVFPWYNLSKGSGIRSSHPTPHSNNTGLKKPTTTPTTAAMTCVTPPSDVPRPHTVLIPPRDIGPTLTFMNEEYRGVRVPQPYDAFLVLDVEATCLPGTDFHWPNEIIVRYHVELCSRSSIKFRNGQFVSSSGQTKELTEWLVPCRKLQNFAALLSQLGAPSYLPFVWPSLA